MKIISVIIAMIFFCDECSKEFTKEPLINRYWTFGYDQCCDKCYLIIQRQYF